jgi:hypothetical protein
MSRAFRYWIFYGVTSFAILLPAFLFWWHPHWDIIQNEFDLFLGQIQFHGYWTQIWWLFIVKILHALLFGLAGIFFSRWAMTGEGLDWKSKAVWIVIAFYLVGIPYMSPDVFFYISKGWMEIHYKMDVFQHSLKEVGNYLLDPMMSNVHPGFIYYVGNYGPLFQKICAIVVLMSHGHIKMAYLFFKLVNFFACLVIAWSMIQINRENGSLVDWKWQCALLNPVFIFNALVTVHNDVLMIVFVVLTFLCIYRNRPILAGGCLGLGFVIKLFPILLLPGFFVYFFKNPRSVNNTLKFLLGILLALMLGYSLYPTAFFNNIQVISAGGDYLRSSLGILLFLIFKQPFRTVRLWMTLGFFVISGLVLLKAWMGRELSFEKLIKLQIAIFLIFFCVGVAAMQEWFLIWVLPLCFLINERRYHVFGLLVGCVPMAFVIFNLGCLTLCAYLAQIMFYLLLLFAVTWLYWENLKKVVCSIPVLKG